MTLQRTALLATASLIFTMGGTFALTQSHQTLAQTTPPASTNQAPPQRGDRGMRVFEQLNLSTEQSQRIQAIQEQERTGSQGLHQQLQQAHEQLRSLMASNASADQLRQQHQQVQNLKQQLDDRRFETMLSIREVLTSQQRTQLAQLEQQHRGRGPGPRPE